MRENTELNSNPQSNKTYRREIILLAIVIILIFVFGELFFRVYYSGLGKNIAVDDNELCLKEMKKPNNYLLVDSNNVIYKQPEWDEDPRIGLVPRKNFSDIMYYVLPETKDKKTKYAILHQDQYHNSQGLTNTEEFQVNKPKNISTRIALFGDSFTCGAETVLKLNMATMLKELIQNIEVLNFCMIGHGIDHMYARYLLESKAYSPDIVVFNVLIDDLRRVFYCPLFRPNIEVIDNHISISKRKWMTLKDFYFHYTPPKYESYFIKHILWVYNKHTKYKRDLYKGLELFNIMIDELKTMTRERNQTLIITPILEQEPNQNEIEIYNQITGILRNKNVLSFDSAQYFKKIQRIYGNQSFYYIPEQDHYKHFSPIGNAIFAQRLKNLLEEKGLVQKTPNYYFANFKNSEFMYLIPQNLTLQIEGKIRTLPAFDVREEAPETQ